MIPPNTRSPHRLTLLFSATCTYNESGNSNITPVGSFLISLGNSSKHSVLNNSQPTAFGDDLYKFCCPSHKNLTLTSIVTSNSVFLPVTR